MVVSSLAIAKYLRERNVSTKLQNELESMDSLHYISSRFANYVFFSFNLV